MAITLNDNIKINAGKPIDTRYLSSGNTAYASTGATNLAIPISERYVGLTVLVNIGGINTEFWYKTGVSDINLVEKKSDSVLPIGDYVTGGTNIGYFSGYSGVQRLPIDHLTNPDYDGVYDSLYNYYYRGTDGITHIGTPSDGIPKRAYVKTSGYDKSWIWNEYVGGSDLVGWVLVDGDVSSNIGTFQNSIVPPYYSGSSQVYTQTSWTTGSAYNNGSKVVINTVTGSLTTGSTISIGARPFGFKDHNNLHFRTIISDTPNTVKVWDDNDAMIHVSGATTTVFAENIGTGVPVYAGTSGTTFMFKKLVGAGNTVVTDLGNQVRIYSSGGTGGGGFYDLSSPSTCTVGGIPSGSTLTGKTAFELFEQMLVPTLYPTFTNPSVSIGIAPSGTFEIGCLIATISVTGTFNAGCIAPQYSAACDKRSCGAQAYCFTGAQINSCTPDINPSRTENVINYVIVDGSQTWGVKAHYQAGVQPYDSKGNYYCAPLPAGATSTANATLTGILPWYWGMSASMTVNAACVAACGCGGGCKCLGNVTSAPIPITFNSTSDDYIWFAVPACSSTKTCWFVNATNNGCIGGSGNLFNNSCTLAINSLEGCWSGCLYEVYVSCYKTGTAAGVPMCMS